MSFLTEPRRLRIKRNKLPSSEIANMTMRATATLPMASGLDDELAVLDALLTVAVSTVVGVRDSVVPTTNKNEHDTFSNAASQT